MATNLDITADLNKLLQKQNALLITQAKIQRSQLAVMVQMAAVFKEIDPSQFASSMSEVDEAIKAAEKSTSKMGESTQNLTAHYDKMSKEVARSMGLTKGWQKDSRDFAIDLTKLSVKASAVQGAFFGWKAADAVVSGFAGVLSGLVETAWNLTTAIVAIPFKILGALFDNAIQGGSEYRRLLEEIRKEFGDLTKNSAKSVVALGRSMKGELADTGLSVYRVFGNLVERSQALFAAAKALGTTFGILRETIAENSEVFAAYYKGLGVSDEAFKALGARAASAGRTIQDIGREMVQFADSMGTAFGINTREITKDVGEMMHDIHNFGNLGVKELSQVSVYARKLGIEFQKLAGVVDAFDNFEKAAEGAAQLAQAFGLNVDAVKLVQEQDPAARFEMLRKSFFATGRSVESMTRQELRLLAAQTGLDEQTLKLGFSLKNQGVSYAQIQKSGDSATKKTLTQEEAMQKLSGSIDRLVKDGQQLQGGLFERFIQGFLKGIQLSGPFRRMMLEISRSLRIVYMAGRQVGRIFVEMFPGVKNIFTAMKELFSADRFRKSMREIVDSFRDFFKGLTSDPASSLKSLMDRLRKAFFNYFDDSSGAGRKLLTGFRDFFSTLLKLAGAGLRIGIKGLIGVIRGLVDVIRDPSSLLKAGGAATGIAGQILEMFMPIVDAMKDMLPPLWEALSDLFSELGTKALGWLKAHSGPIISGLGTVFALYIGSAITGAVVSGFVAGAAQKAGMMLVDLLGTSMKGVRSPGRGLAGSLRGAAEGARGAGGVSSAVRESGLTKGAPINWGAIAVVIAGVAAVAVAIFFLAREINAQKIPMSAVLTAAAIMGTAVVLVAALGGLMYEMISIAPALAGAPALLPAVAGTFALGAAVAGGMYLLVQALGNVNVSQVGTATVTMLAGIGIMAALGLLLGEFVLVGALAAGLGLAALVGVVSAFALGTAIAKGMPSLLKEVNNLDSTEMSSAAGIIGNMSIVLGAIAGLTTTLGLIGAVFSATGGAAMLAVVTGIETLNQVTKSLVSNTHELLTSINEISFADGFKERFDVFIGTVEAITGFGTMITELGASTSAGWLATLLGASDQQVHNLQALEGVIDVMRTSLVGVIQGIADAVSGIEGGDAVLNRAQAIASVVTAITGVVGGLVPPADSPFWEDSTWNGIDDVRGRLSQYSSSIVLVLGSLRGLVSGVIEEFTRPEFANAAAAFGTEGGAKAIQGITSVFEVVGRLGSSLAGTVMTQLRTLKADANVSEVIENAGSFIRELMSSLFRGGFLESVTGVITGIVTGTANLTNAQIGRFQAVSPMFTAMFGAISGIGDAIAAATTLSASFEDPTASAGALDGINTFVTTIFRGILTLVRTALPSILESFKGLKSGDVSRIKAGTSILQSVFQTISSVTSSIQPLYDLARTAGGGATDFASIRNGLGTVFSLFWDSTGEGGKTYEGIPTMLNRVAESFGSINVSGFRSTAGAVKSMIRQVNDVSNSFRSLNDNPLNISTELKRLATNLGVGSREEFTIRHESFNVTINVEVKLLIEELEEAVKNRPGGSRFVISTNPT